MHIPPALKHRRFFLLWLGLLISITGTQMQIWALFWHIRELTPHPIALGGIGLARIGPVIVFSLIGGALADSADRRRILFWTQSSAALLALTLGLLTEFGHIRLWHIYLITALGAIAVAFDGPARQALVPNLVPSAELPNAFSLTSIAFQTGSVLGPALSGVAIAAWGQEAVYYLNAASFLGMILALILIGPTNQTFLPQQKGVKWAAIRDGIRFTYHQPMIFSTMILDFIATFFASANTLMPILARDVLRVGVVEYGWLSAAQSVGAVIVALVVSQLRQLQKQGPLFLGSVFVFGAATILFGLSRSFVVAWFSLVLVGAADGLSTIIRNTIRQLNTPDHLRGRMTSVNQIFFQGGPQLGEIEAGVVAQLFGAPFAVVSGGIGCLLGLGWVIRQWPQLLTYNGHEPLTGRATAD